MTLTRSKIAALVVLLAGLVVLYLILGRAVHAPPQSLANLRAEAPHPVPDVSFVDDKGRTHRLREFQGRYVLVNLWGTWCAPCARELPSLAKLGARMPDLAVVAIALPPGSPGEAKAFLAGHGAGALQTYFDGQTMIFRAFRAYALPITVLINPRGDEVARAIGPANWGAPDAIAYLKSVTNSASRSRSAF